SVFVARNIVGSMPTGAIFLGAVAAVVMALLARARASNYVHHEDWAQIRSKDNLLPVEQNNIGIGLMLYKLDEFINNITVTSQSTAGCNDAILSTEAYRRNAEKSCCKDRILVMAMAVVAATASVAKNSQSEWLCIFEK
ncbi:unnamed protein product, partial [Meganyctiphanes norvegica]